MILVCGATGMLRSRIVTLLQREGLPVRALVRPSTDAAALEATGVEIAHGDLRARDSLRAAVQGISSIVSTANSVARVMGGERGLTIGDVDDQGYASLIEEADAAGVRRFVFLSFADEILDSGTPFARAKRATEQRLRDSPMRETIVRPEMFQEVWLTELVQFDWKAGKLTIFGKGNASHRYVSVDDVAAAVVHLVKTDDPPRVFACAGPEAMSRIEAAEAFERATGSPMKRNHVPRPGLRIGSFVLRPFRPVLASIMGQALSSDDHASSATDEPMRAIGIQPRPASRYIEMLVAGAPNGDAAPSGR